MNCKCYIKLQYLLCPCYLCCSHYYKPYVTTVTPLTIVHIDQSIMLLCFYCIKKDADDALRYEDIDLYCYYFVISNCHLFLLILLKFPLENVEKILLYWSFLNWISRWKHWKHTFKKCYLTWTLNFPSFLSSLSFQDETITHSLIEASGFAISLCWNRPSGLHTIVQTIPG